MDRRIELPSLFAMTIGLALLAGQAIGQEAAPENPSGLAQQIVVPDAQDPEGRGAGDTVSVTATEGEPGQLATNI